MTFREVRWCFVFLAGFLAQTASGKGAGDVEGKEFLKLLRLPGMQGEAVQVAASDPGAFLAILEEAQADVPQAFALMVETELRLLMSETEAAKYCVVELGKMGEGEAGEWSENRFPVLSILKDESRLRKQSSLGFHRGQLAAEFCGSHRDNWLIQKAVMLKLPKVEAMEYERVWQGYLKLGSPHLFQPEITLLGAESELFWRNGMMLPPSARRFALDYAMYLKKAGDEERGLDVLREVLEGLWSERANRGLFGWKASEKEKVELPVISFTPGIFYGGHSLAMLGYSNGEPSNPVDSSPVQFLRVAYGFFKEAGKEEELIKNLEAGVTSGRKHFQKIIARIHFHEGKMDEFVKLESRYLESLGMDVADLLMALARLHEEAGRPVEAIAHYKAALTILDQRVEVKGVEVENNGRVFRQAFPNHKDAIIASLTRLYQGQGRAEDAFLMALKKFELGRSGYGSVKILSDLAQQAERLEINERFQSWLRGLIKNKPDAPYLAAAHWSLGNERECALAFARSYQADEPIYRFDDWRARFSGKGEKSEQVFLEAILEVVPDYLPARVVMWKRDLKAADDLALMNDLVQSEANFIFLAPGNRSPLACFRNRYHLAEELLKRAREIGDEETLRKVTLKLAAGEAPFGTWEKRGLRESYPGESKGEMEDLSSCLAVMIQFADEATLGTLKKLWADHWDHPGKRQLERRLSWGETKWGSEKLDSVQWMNLPAGTKRLVSARTVLSLLWDGEQLYTGHPWGILIWDKELQPIKRVALPEPAREIVMHKGAIWAGGNDHLFRIMTEDWSVDQLSLREGIEFDWRTLLKLVVVENQLWIGTNATLMKLDLETLDLRYFSMRELKTKNYREFATILADGKYVWVSGRAGTRRYDTEREVFDRVISNGKEVQLVALIDGQLFGECHVHEILRDRLCLIDRESLEVHPLMIRTPWDKALKQYGDDFYYAGKAGGKLLFREDSEIYQFESETMELVKFANKEKGQTILPSQNFYEGLSTSRAIQSDEISGDVPLGAFLEFKLNPSWKLCFLPDGRCLSARSGQSWVFDDAREIEADQQEDGSTRGLFSLAKNGESSLLAGVSGGAFLGGDWVHDVVVDQSGLRWLCTNFGLSVLNQDDQVIKEFTKADGLLHHRMVRGLRIEGGVVFQDRQGGVIQFDSETGMFLRVLDSEVDFSTAANDSKISEIPHLGGRCFFERQIAWRHYLGTRRGVLIANSAAKLSGPVVGVLRRQLIVDPAERLKAEAEQLKIRMPSLKKAMEFAKDENPYVQLELTMSLPPYVGIAEAKTYLPVWRSLLGSRLVEVRVNALSALRRYGGVAELELVRPLMKDPEQEVRDLAMVAMIRFGEVPDLEMVSDFLERTGTGTGSRSLSSELIAALAQGADREIFEFLMTVPISSAWSEGSDSSIAVPLGKALRKHPDAVDVLLTATNRGADVGPRMNYGTIRFVREIFKEAGAELLPQLHEALKSENRVIRSNAALACGAIGEASSIDSLLASLDQESALSRASAVWALGKLQATKALPRLESLYHDLVSQRGLSELSPSSGLAMQNAFDFHQREKKWIQRPKNHQKMNELERFEWEREFQVDRPEFLLNEEVLLSAIREIGAEHAQAFYRGLVGQGSHHHILEITAQLGAAKGKEREKSLAVLQQLLAHRDERVRALAAKEISRLRAR